MIFHFIIIIIFINYFHIFYHPSSILSPQSSFTPIYVRVGVRLGVREGRWAAGWSGGRGRRGGGGGRRPGLASRSLSASSAPLVEKS